MEVFPKFIIETDPELGKCLIIAKCNFHKQLVVDKDKVSGGGWWRLNKETNTIILYGDSHDFGRASIEDITECINNGMVFRNLSCSASIADLFNFSYDTQTELIRIK